MSRVDEILKETRAFVSEKQASFKEKSALAGQDPNTIPGSEHDSAVESSMKQSDPEVKQELPPKGTSAEGASEAGQVEQGHATDVTQRAGGPHDTAKKEPAITADANAGTSTNTVSDQPQKKAADTLGNSLLASIKEAQEASKAKEEPKEEPVKKASAEGDEPNNTPSEAPEKNASPSEGIDLTPDVLAKIASVLLSSEEGWEVVDAQLKKQAGAETARATMEFLTKTAEENQKQAAMAQGYADADALIKQALYMKGYQDAQASSGEPSEKTAAEQEYAEGAKTAEALIGEVSKAIEKAAKAHSEPKPSIIEELGRKVAEASVKAAQEADMDYAGGEDELGGEEAAGALDEMAGMPADEEMTAEDLAAAVQALVDAGQIDPEQAAQITDYIANAGAVEGAAGAPAADMDEGMAEPAEGMEVAAEAKNILTLLENVAKGE